MTATPRTISVVVTFHAEGELAPRTLQGLERLRRHAEDAGVAVELVVVLDSADADTTSAVKASEVLRDCDQVLEFAHGDPGTSRNCGIAAARGSFIGICDGDDYCTDNWLTGALEVCVAANGDVIVHPELTISFGAVHCVARSLDMEANPLYPMQNCMVVHPWISCSFGTASNYKATPYGRTNTAETGFGFEDWHWNLETIAAGVKHVIAPGTAYFYRRRPASTLTGEVASGAIIRPTRFLDHPERWQLRLRSHAASGSQTTVSSSDEAMPLWAVEGLRRVAELEPSLYPTVELLSRYFTYSPPWDLAPGELYAKSVGLIGGFAPEVLVVVPWLEWGSNEDAEWQRALVEQLAGTTALVVTTYEDGASLSSNIPEMFRVLEFGELARSFTVDQQISALTRLILQSRASTLYVIGSTIGLSALERHGKSIAATGKAIYVGVRSTPDNLEAGGKDGSSIELKRWGSVEDCSRVEFKAESRVAAADHSDLDSPTMSRTVECELEQLRTSVAWLSKQSADWKEAFENGEAHTRALEATLEELRAGNAWLVGQSADWKEAFENGEAHIRALEAALEELRAGNAWLLGQRDAWERVAAENGRDASAYREALNFLMQTRAYRLLRRVGLFRQPGQPGNQSRQVTP